MKRVVLVVCLVVCGLLWNASYGMTICGADTISEPVTMQGEMIDFSDNRVMSSYENHIAYYDSASLDSFIRDHMDAAHIPGLATWAFKNGQVIWQQCYGYANLEDSIEVADTTLFSLASISKTITGTAIMQLWERGFFQLDDDISDYLPFSVRCPAYPDSILTFRMLMTHTSSICDNDAILSSLWVVMGDSPIPLRTFLQEYLVPGGSYYSPANFNGSVPGTQYDYSSVAIGLLGCLVEALEDSFPIYCQDSIFDPLSMSEASWFLATLDTNNLARAYHWTGSFYAHRPWWGCPWYPGNQLRLSLVQLAQYLTAIAQYGVIDTVRILDSTTVELILSHQFEVGADWWIGLIWHHAGWAIANRWVWGHNGAGDGVDTWMSYCPEESTAVIALANCDNYGCSWIIAEALHDYAHEYVFVEENEFTSIKATNCGPTIFRGPLQLPAGKECKVFDITGRVVEPDRIQAGIYFLEIDGKIVQKVIKVR